MGAEPFGERNRMFKNVDLREATQALPTGASVQTQPAFKFGRAEGLQIVGVESVGLDSAVYTLDSRCASSGARGSTPHGWQGHSVGLPARPPGACGRMLAMSKKSRSLTDLKGDPKTVAFWSFIAFALVVGVGMYYANVQRTPPASANAPYTPGPAPAQVSSKLAILGDSYTAGAGAAVDEGFGQQVAALLCWDGAYFGQGGTGYTNPGQLEEGESVYLQRVNAVIEARPDVVVVQGSTNDSGGPANTDQARKVFSAIRAGLPNAQIVALGPVAPPKEDPAKVAASRDAVRVAAEGERIPFIDPIAVGWMPGSFNFGEDGINLNRFGHKLMAENLFGAIRQLNLPNLTRC
ncbi:hypothetical protein C5613_10075 [Rhodococcus opacus]|uniref:SGNH hydrolase-type esterase domain-containing protein n=2 Tax=Rhodococcus opacus TaxID=37919 RepID=A0A2S8JDU2_RHOOP|nr:hypothetical protein C5613_10075 [Rhodococcus opacus]